MTHVCWDQRRCSTRSILTYKSQTRSSKNDQYLADNKEALTSNFSAVSTPTFAIKYSLENSLQDLPNPNSSSDLNHQFFCRISDIFNLIQFIILSRLCHTFIQHSSTFDELNRQFVIMGEGLLSVSDAVETAWRATDGEHGAVHRRVGVVAEPGREPSVKIR